MAKPTAKGQATVEFALILVVLLTVLYGILEVSRLLLINAEIQNAAREGAQYAALHPAVDPTTCLRDRIVYPKLVLADRSRITVSSSFPPAAALPATDPNTLHYPVQVTVDYQWTSLVSIVPYLNDLTLEATSTALIENPDHSGTCP